MKTGCQALPKYSIKLGSGPLTRMQTALPSFPFHGVFAMNVVELLSKAETTSVSAVACNQSERVDFESFIFKVGFYMIDS